MLYSYIIDSFFAGNKDLQLVSGRKILASSWLTSVFFLINLPFNPFSCCFLFCLLGIKGVGVVETIKILAVMIEGQEF